MIACITLKLQINLKSPEFNTLIHIACTPVHGSHSLLDFHLSIDVKKKALPMWIREGLEKLEKKKQKKQDQGEDEELKKSSVNLSASGSSSIAGYDHGKVDSPVRTPKSNDSDEVCVNLLHFHC